MPRIPAHQVLLTLALAACSQAPSTVLAPDTPAHAQGVASATHADVAAPFTGSCETELSPAEILSPGVIRQVDTGSCGLSHLGFTHFLSDKVIRIAAGTQTTEATFTAANGDILRAVGTGTNSPAGPGRVRFTMALTFAGGTGRFAGATGEARAEGESDLVGRRAALTLNGRIAYEASDRSR